MKRPKISTSSRSSALPTLSIRKAALVGTLATALVGSVAVVAHGDGYPASRVALSGGGAWLASPTQGLVTLIDGASEQVVGSLRAPGAKRGDALSVVQHGASAYIGNEAQGTVARVDGATYEVSDPIRFTGERGGALGIFAGPKSLYVVDSQRRAASVADPLSLQVRERLSLVAQPGEEQSVVDAGGRLWVLDREKGGLTWFDGGKRNRPGTGNQADRLVLVQGGPVLVDSGSSRLGRLTPDGTVDRWSCLELRSGDRAQLLGSASSDRVFAAIPASGTLVANSIGRDDCGMSVDVGEPGDEFGPLAEASGFVFVPNRTRGRALVVDVAAGRVAGDLPVAKPGARLELLAKDGFVFYNDLDGENAGVIRLDGGRWTAGKGVQKFKPSDDGRGILTPAGDRPQNEQGKPPADPGNPPGKTAPTTAPPAEPTRRDPPRSNPTDQNRPDVPPPGPNLPDLPPPDQNRPDVPPPGPNLPDLPPPDPTLPDPEPDPGTGDPSPTAPASEQPPLVPPIIREIRWMPGEPVRGKPVTFTGVAAQAEDAIWRWTLTRPNGAAFPAHTGSEFTVTLPTGDPRPYTIKLELTGPGGAATPMTKSVSTTSPGAPRFASFTANPRIAAVGQEVTFTAVETVTGADGVWRWTIYEIATGHGILIHGPTPGLAQQPFRHTFHESGKYQVRVTVDYDGETNTVSTPVDVGDNCTIRPDAGAVDLRGQASAVVVIRVADCAGPLRVTASASAWLQVPATFTVPASGSTTVTVRIVGPPEVEGRNLDALRFTLANGKFVTRDVMAHLAPPP